MTGLRIEGTRTHFSATVKEGPLGAARSLRDWSVPIPGEHIALNALAAFAVCAEAGIRDDLIRDAMASFSGVKRRFQPTGEWNGVAIYDDYGHHPIEIAAVLRAARQGARGRVLAVVEPHRYSRVKELFADFSSCLADADAVIVAPLYSAGEAPVQGISHHALASAIRRTGHRAVEVAETADHIPSMVATMTSPQDTVIFFGAGQSTDWAHALPEQLDAMFPVRSAV